MIRLKKIIERQIITTALTIKIAQFIKNCSGSAIMISVSLASNCQLVLFGKKIKWKTTNTLVKSITAKITIIIIKASIEKAETKAGCIENGRQRVIHPRFFKIKVKIKIALEVINTIRLRLNSTLQSAKCDAPSCEQ